MNLRNIIRSVLVRSAAAAAVAAAAPAFALAPADYFLADGVTPDPAVLNVYYGGATATDNVLENFFLVDGQSACAPGTIDIYRVPTANRNNRVVFCRITANQVTGFPASNIVGGVETGGTKVAFHKESIGGSSNGVVPLVNLPPGNTPDNLDFFDMTQAAACAAPVAAGGPGTGLTAFNNRNNCPDIPVQRVPHGGISDTEPRLSFPSVTAGVTSRPGLAIVFGVPVTTNLYRALQVAQGITARPECDTLAEQDTPACVPSLTSSQVRGIYNQRITDWSQLRGPGNVPLPMVPGVAAPTNNAVPAAANRVFICRRVATSGTQASFESYWLQQRCTVPFPAFAGGNPLVGGVPNFNAPVTAGESSGDVRSCLNAHNTNNSWAIGVLSTEVTAANLTAGNFRMVAIDGARPNLATVANGDYDFFTENTLNRSAGIVLPTLINALLTDIETNIGRPAVLSLANTPFQGRPWGDGGVLTLAGAAGSTPNTPTQVDGAGASVPAPTPNTMRGNPVNTMTRTIGATVNNCSPPVIRQPSPVDLSE